MYPLQRRPSGRLGRAVFLSALSLLGACSAATPPAPAPHPAPRSRPAPAAEPDAPASQTLAVPVQGVRPEQLRDSYSAARSGGRVHRAIDIMAARGTPVIAAEDGTLLQPRTRGMGGISVYQLSRDGRRLLYYAHLDRYADGVREGAAVRKGEVIGYVGDTGNAGAGNFHLHFAVTHLPRPGRWGEAEGGYDINPYPLLVGAGTGRRAGL